MLAFLKNFQMVIIDVAFITHITHVHNMRKCNNIIRNKKTSTNIKYFTALP